MMAIIVGLLVLLIGYFMTNTSGETTEQSSGSGNNKGTGVKSGGSFPGTLKPEYDSDGNKVLRNEGVRGVYLVDKCPVPVDELNEDSTLYRYCFIFEYVVIAPYNDFSEWESFSIWASEQILNCFGNEKYSKYINTAVCGAYLLNPGNIVVYSDAYRGILIKPVDSHSAAVEYVKKCKQILDLYLCGGIPQGPGAVSMLPRCVDTTVFLPNKEYYFPLWHMGACAVMRLICDSSNNYYWQYQRLSCTIDTYQIANRLKEKSANWLGGKRKSLFKVEVYTK